MGINRNSKTHFKGNLDKRLAFKETQDTVLKEGALEKAWLPEDIDSLLSLPEFFSEVLKS